MMDRAVREGLLRLMPPDVKFYLIFIFSYSLLAWVCVDLVKQVKIVGATYAILQLLRVLVIAHALRFVQSAIYKVPPECYLQNVLKFHDLPITATISAFYTIFLTFPSPPNIILFLAHILLLGMILIISSRNGLEQDISPTQGSSSNTDQQNPIDIKVTDHFATILLAMMCVDLAVELEKLMGTYYVFSMVFVIASRHMPYICQLVELPGNSVPLAFHLQKILQYYEIPSTAAINGIYIIFITFSKTLFLVFCMESTLLAILMYKREKLGQGTNPSPQASSLDTNSLSVHQQSLDVADIGNANSISDTIKLHTKLVDQSDFSKWKRGKEIGHGNYGHVYVYRNSENPAEKRAVKILNIRADGTNDSALREVGIIIKLRDLEYHPNIVNYHDCYMDKQGCIYLFMKYVKKGSLKNYMKKRGRLAEQVIQDFTSQILSGLLHLHSNQIVHRDIKPENLLVDTKDSKDIIKLVDFGFSKELANSQSKHTIGGTLCFMAPEMLGRKEYERRKDGFATDIWSLGCVIIEMFTRDFINNWSLGKREDPPIPEGLSKRGKDFLQRCFQKNPADRPSVAELLQDPFVAQTGTLMEESARINVCEAETETSLNGGDGSLCNQTSNVTKMKKKYQ